MELWKQEGDDLLARQAIDLQELFSGGVPLK
jgi:hypothetical protein